MIRTVVAGRREWRRSATALRPLPGHDPVGRAPYCAGSFGDQSLTGEVFS